MITQLHLLVVDSPYIAVIEKLIDSPSTSGILEKMRSNGK